MKKILIIILILVITVIFFSYCRPKDVVHPIIPTISITKAIDVNWTISSSDAISYFQLEKLDTTTKAYSPIARIDLNNSLSYSYVDRSLYDKLNTYRLKMVLKDSSSFYSTIVK
jgi:hypothetical protein